MKINHERDIRSCNNDHILGSGLVAALLCLLSVALFSVDNGGSFYFSLFFQTNETKLFFITTFTMNYKIYIPSQKQFDKVLYIFSYAEKYAKKAGIRYNILKSVVSYSLTGDLAATMCPYGIYALVSTVLGFRRFKKGLSYSEGYKWISEDLGFENCHEFHCWLAINNHIWGNAFGARSPFTSEAYTPNRLMWADKFEHITDHWREVAMRCQLLELNLKQKIFLQ